jgi:GST-like protein
LIQLYTWSTPNGRKISIALEELGLEYEVVPIDIGKGEQFDPEFLAISPNNQIPAIVDGDLTLMDSGAILLYLAAKTGRLVPSAGTPEYFRMLQWLMWQIGNFGPMLGQAHHFLTFNRGKSDYAEDRYFKEAQRLYTVLERQLDGCDHVAGDLSIADIAIWCWVSRYSFQRIDLEEYPKVLRWYLRLADRPAFERGYAVPEDAGPIPRPD